MSEPTTIFSIYDDKDREIRAVLTEVYRALKEKGYNPINQLVGYILSEDPTYITTYQGARSLIRKIDRDDLLQALLKSYLGEEAEKETRFMAFTPKLTYKGRPLVRCKNDIYYGSLSDPYVIFMQVLTSKEENGVQVADRIHVTLLSTDTTKSPIERMKKQSDKNGLWSALEIGTIWLEKSLLDAKKEEKK